MLIVGITGTNGAGKGSVVNYLKKKGFEHYSVRDYLIEEIRKRDMPVDRNSMIEVGNDLRARYGSSYLVEELFRIAQKKGIKCIIESIRTVGEIEGLRELGEFVLFAVDCDRKLRYERVIKRKSETDRVSFEEFCEKEDLEMESRDPTKQNIGACIKEADFVLDNGSDFDNLYKQIDTVLLKIQND